MSIRFSCENSEKKICLLTQRAFSISPLVHVISVFEAVVAQSYEFKQIISCDQVQYISLQLITDDRFSLQICSFRTRMHCTLFSRRWNEKHITSGINLAVDFIGAPQGCFASVLSCYLSVIQSGAGAPGALAS